MKTEGEARAKGKAKGKAKATGKAGNAKTKENKHNAEDDDGDMIVQVDSEALTQSEEAPEIRPAIKCKLKQR